VHKKAMRIREEIPDDTHKCSSFQGYPKVNQKGILSIRKSARKCRTKPVSHKESFSEAKKQKVNARSSYS